MEKRNQSCNCPNRMTMPLTEIGVLRKQPCKDKFVFRDVKFEEMARPSDRHIQ